VLGGARWFHISNAALWGVRTNPGHNALQLYLGVMLAW